MLLLASALVTLLVPINPSVGPNRVVQPEVRIIKSSWYGPHFYGKPMANGKPFNAEAMTVAHPDLPFGTKLLLYNVDNGKQVVVTVTDRGPFVKGRGLDCSEGVARKLGFWRKGIQQLLTIRLNHIVPKPSRHSRLKMTQAKAREHISPRASPLKLLPEQSLGGNVTWPAADRIYYPLL